MTGRTRAGFARFPAVGPGSRIGLVAPASPFPRDKFDAGVAELRRLGFEPVYDDRVFSRQPIVAGSADLRASAFMDAWSSAEIDAVLAVRGGYGSVEVLPRLDSAILARRTKAFIGYSDVTSIHAYLNGVIGVTSVHGAMIDGRLAHGPSAYDVSSFVGSLSREPLGEIAPDTLEVVHDGEASGPLVGGTLTQILASFGTPFEAAFPPGAVLFIDEVGERPYRLRRQLVQLVLTGRLGAVSAVIFGQLPRCDEPDGVATARGVVETCLADFSKPVLFGFPSGHSTTPLVSVPFGVNVRVIARGAPRVVFEEAAAE